MARILVIDDDEQVLRSIQRVLQDDDSSYEVLIAQNGLEGLDVIARQRPNLVILDIVMPEMDGLEVCRRLRADPFTARLPVLFLTAKGRPIDVAGGLDIGADDYLVKPFEVIELPARVRALLRRVPGGTLDPSADYVEVGDLKLSINRLEVEIDSRTIELTPVEHRLLHQLMRHAGQPISIHQLLEDVWDYPRGVGDPKLVRVHVVNLRAKIEPQPDNPTYLVNVRGRGYMIAI